MEKLSVFLITKNEEQRLDKTLKAIKPIADEIIILDSGSTDQTRQIAEAHNAKFSTRPFDGFGQQKHAAQELCSHNWVLNLDADEVVTADLREEITEFLKNPEMSAHYDGAEMRIVNVLPQEQKPRPFARTYHRIRLYNKNKLGFPRHSTFDNINRRPAYKIHNFKHIIHHYSFLNLPELEAKMRERAIFYFNEEKRGSQLKNILRLPFEFIISFFKAYFLRGHITGGLYGLGNSYIYAKYRHIRIWQRVLNRPIVK